LPQYWQTHAQQTFLVAGPSPTSSASTADAAKKVGGIEKPPELLKAVDPKVTEAAHNLKYPAKVVIQLIAEKDGTPSQS
jgi:hypothetical protein